MSKWSNILGSGLMVGSLVFALMAPGQAFANGSLVADSSSSTTTTTTSTTTGVVPVGGYWDQYGTWHVGTAPYNNGYYDQNGTWHSSSTIVSNMPNGYYDTKGVWHTGMSPYSNGTYDQNGVWHSTTVVTSTSTGNGYYDTNGTWHTGLNPYSGGWYDQSGMWHTGAMTSTSSYTTNTMYGHHDIYSQDAHNYYAGYGTIYDINRGYITVIGADGLPHQVDLKANRTMVRLSSDNNMSPKLDVERGFDRGMADAPMNSFDPSQLTIPTGTHVTFWAEDGTHTIQPMDGDSLKQSVIINPGQVFTYTFTQPGLYRFDDSFGGGPSGPALHGLVIRVKGQPVAFDDSMFVDSSYMASSTTMTTASVISQPDTFNAVTTTTLPETAEINTNTVHAQDQSIQVQGQKTVAPVKKVHKQILRNHDMK